MASSLLTRVIHDGVKLSRTDPRKREKWTIEGTECLGPPLWSRKSSEPPRKAGLGSAGPPGVWSAQQASAGRSETTPPPGADVRSLRPCLETNLTSAQPCARPAAHGRRTGRLWLVYGGEGLLPSMRSSSQRELVAGSSPSIHHVR